MRTQRGKTRGTARRTARPAGTSGRRARRRDETRSRLLSAAREVMARKGIGSTSIQEITDTADVGFGSFYNHFPSKEAIADAVMEDALERFGAAADRLVEILDDPAEVLAASVRHAVRMAATDQAWGWFLVRTTLTRANALHSSLGQRLARDIEIGIRKRRFTTDDPVGTMVAAGGAILATMAVRLHGELGDDAPERAATAVLRLLGLPPREARAVARRPLPAIVPLSR